MLFALVISFIEFQYITFFNI